MAGRRKGQRGGTRNCRIPDAFLKVRLTSSPDGLDVGSRESTQSSRRRDVLCMITSLLPDILPSPSTPGGLFLYFHFSDEEPDPGGHWWSCDDLPTPLGVKRGAKTHWSPRIHTLILPPRWKAVTPTLTLSLRGPGAKSGFYFTFLSGWNT